MNVSLRSCVPKCLSFRMLFSARCLSRQTVFHVFIILLLRNWLFCCVKCGRQLCAFHSLSPPCPSLALHTSCFFVNECSVELSSSTTRTFIRDKNKNWPKK